MTGTGFRVIVIAFGITNLSSAQTLDTSLSRDTTGPQRYTILEQITDPKERRDFLKLYGAREPHNGRRLAERFVTAYPRLWLVGQAYEIAAKVCIDVHDDPAAPQFSRESLRLLPENPLLLVPVASVQLELGRLAEAEKSARDALEYLDQFVRPASIPASEWPAVQGDLKASSYFTLGRAAIAESPQAPNGAEEEKMHEAEAFLLRARALRADDPAIAYVLGLSELSLAKTNDASFYFAQAQPKPGPMRVKAIQNRQRIFALSNHAAGKSFETFVESTERGVEPTPLRPLDAKPMRFEGSAYAGSESCEFCHSAIYAAWQKTGMGRMFRQYKAENVIGDFPGNNQFSDATGALVARMTVRQNIRYVSIREKSGAWRTYPLDFTIGSRWQQAYATRPPVGDNQVFPVPYSAVLKEWINYWKVIDPPSSPQTDVLSFNKPTSATSYQINCAPCHTSQLRLSKPDSTSGHDYEFVEGGVNCEICHGPGKDHVLAMKASTSAANARLGRIQNFREISARDYVAICGQCHAQSAVRQPGVLGEVKYPAASTPFPRFTPAGPYRELARRALYKDGRFRETTFIMEAFRRSACFRKGQSHCGHCHQPHEPSSAANLTSLKLRGNPNQMCLQCHDKFAADISAHTRHSAAAEASQCAPVTWPAS
jgi:predicted CXXCH cytochrome family protein